ncbi:hypothetical protein GGQ68_002487 [Sagittula marina]|uniref:Uncharacterized protein n=1 Tax=Sagittula marina TaxID=943940 RepID=A0A7W6GUB2_9RHOB|nr:hypothetical protein [Sagittula marina]MBB3986149.1 hypothetical protein [Sagittula marina]
MPAAGHPNRIARRAAMLCQDTRFRRFAAQRSGLPTAEATTEAAAEYLRRFCHVTSRRDLDTDNDAATRFATLRTEFDAWTGRIASQR